MFDIDADVGYTVAGGVIGGVEENVSAEAVIDVGGEGFGQGITENDSGAAVPLVEREPEIGHKVLGLTADVVILGVVVF